MNFHKFVHDWILPPKMYRFVGQMHFDYGSEVSGTLQKAHERAKSFENKYRGKRCFVLGNGPSLKGMDLNLLRNEITIVMNRFYFHEMCKTWKPTFFCAVDRRDSFNLELLDDILTNIFPTDGYFFHISMEPLFQHSGYWKENKYYAKTGVAVDTITDVRKGWNLHRTIPGCRSTSQLAIILAMYLGCNPIYLLGMDSDWLSHRGQDKHFYKSDGIGHNLETTPYTDLIAATLRQFRGYKVIKQYADYREISIMNAAPGSFLDVFPMVKYDDLFGDK